jgi:cholesterol oxidase
MNKSQDFDVIVIGSGYGGASAAESLSRAGLKVCIVERGTWWGAFEGHRPLPETLPQVLRSLARLNLSAFGRGVSIPLSNRGLLEVSLHQGTIVVNAAAVGGNSLVSGNYMKRPAPQFFAALPPELTAAELAPHYERIEHALEVSPGPRDEDKQARLSALAGREKWQLGTTPQSIRWESDDPASKPPCTLCNRCMFGCNVGAKLSFDKTLIASAMKAGAVVRDLCTVQTVARVPGGYEVRSRDARKGSSAVLRTPRVVVAAGAMNTLKILLRSTATGVLDPIPGLGLHFSLGADWIAFYRTPSDIWPKTVSGHVLEADMRVPGPGNDFDHQILCATGPLVPGSWLLRTLQGRRALGLVGFGPDAMDGEVSWKGGGTVVRHQKQDVVGRIQSTLDRVAGAYGWNKTPRQPDPKRRARPWLSAHPIGGCRMATDASRGVVDFKGEVFGHPGLYVADASVLPIMTIAGPQLSVSALASWISERIVKDTACGANATMNQARQRARAEPGTAPLN